MELTGIRRRIISNAPHLATRTGNLIEIKRAEKANVKRFEIAFDQPEIQDLHGYAKPWIGGEGKNIFDKDNATYVTGKYINDAGVIKSQNSYQYIENYIEVKPETTYTVQMNRTSDQGFTVPLYDANQDFIQRETPIGSGSTHGLISGTFTTTSATKYIRFSCPNTTAIRSTIMIEEGSDMSAYEPYENYCPITGGITGCEVVAAGKNLFDQANAVIYERNINDNDNWATNAIGRTYAFQCKPNTDYVVSAFSDTIDIFRAGYIESAIPSGSGNVPVQDVVRRTEQGSIQLHTSANATYIIVQVNGSLIADTPIQIEVGTTASAYEQFNGTTVPVSWSTQPGVIFKGDLNLLTGVLHVDSAVWTLKGTESWAHVWGASEANGVFRVGTKYPFLPNSSVNCIANFSNADQVTSNTTTHGIYFGVGTTKYFNVRNSMSAERGSKTDSELADEWAAYVAQRYADGKPLEILCRGINKTYQLTPQQVKLLTGRNAVWSTPGTTTLKFWTH